MIVNISSAFVTFFQVATYSLTDTGYLKYKGTPIQLSSNSPVLKTSNLRRICNKLQSSSLSSIKPVPLFKLTEQKVPHDLVYRVDGCTAKCYDLYLECNTTPFRLDDSGDLRLSFESKWSAVCFKPPLKHHHAVAMCRKLKLPSSDVTLLPGEARNYTTSWLWDDACVLQSCSQIRRLTKDACTQQHQFVAINCSKLNPVIRILNRTKSELRGVMEINTGDNWLPVCVMAFSLNDATVVCRSLGYPSSNANYNLIKTDSRSLDRPGAFNCKGNEASLSDCPGLKLAYSYCHSGHTVEVSCAKAKAGDLRLAGGYDTLSGRLEIYHNNSWGAVCGYGGRSAFGKEERRTACVQISNGQIKHGKLIIYGVPVLPAATKDTIFLDRVNCRASPDRLENCYHHPWREHRCIRSRPAVVFMSCSDMPSYRLVSGRLEVYHSGEWGTICNVEFGHKEARSACKTLNLPSALAKLEYPSVTQASSSRIWLERIECDDDSDDLNDCTHGLWGKISNLCSHAKDVYLSCESPDSSKAKYSIHGASSDELGYVKLEYEDFSGRICMQSRSDRIAAVACRSLKLPDQNAQLLPASMFEVDNSRAYMKGVRCNGREDQLMDCDYYFLPRDSTCNSLYILAVACGTSALPDYSLRLVNGPENSGRLEVSMYGVWGTVCADRFGRDEAVVACRSMNKPTEEAKTTEIWRYGRGRAVTWLYGVSCLDYYGTSFAQCKSNIAPSVCGSGDHVAISCKPGKAVDKSGQVIGAILGGTAAFFIAVFVIVCIVKRRMTNPHPLPPHLQPGRRGVSNQQDRTIPPRSPRNNNAEQTRLSEPANNPYSFTNSDFTHPEVNMDTIPPPSDETKPPPGYYELFPERRFQETQT